LVSFKNGRQQFLWFPIVGRDLTRLSIARRLQENWRLQHGAVSLSE
jgi:hypothetical protein